MSALSFGAFVLSIPRPVSALFLLVGYAVAVRWEFRASQLPDAGLLILLVYRPSVGLLAWVALLLAVRHVPTLARDLACLMRLAEFDGWTARAVLFALPALQGDAVIMSNAAPETSAAIDPDPVHVPVPGSALVSAVPPNELDMRDQFLITMADQKDARGAYLFSANQIHAAIGGHRATVLAMVKDRRASTLPPVYRDQTGDTVPATNPVSGKS